MVANVSRITGACQLLQGDAAAQVQPKCTKLPETAAVLQHNRSLYAAVCHHSALKSHLVLRCRCSSSQTLWHTFSCWSV